MCSEAVVEKANSRRKEVARYPALERLFVNSGTVAHLYELLESVNQSDKVGLVIEDLESKGFDVAGVKNKATGETLGYVVRAELQGKLVGEQYKEIGSRQIISDSTPLADIINIFRDREFVFVLSGNSIEGIVTQADINKPAARIYLFGMLSLFEMHLDFWIKELFENESWFDHLSDDRGAGVDKRYIERKFENKELSRLECLYLDDKKSILLRSVEFKNEFGYSSKDFKKFMYKVARVRNSITHNHESILAGRQWSSFAAIIDGLIEFLICSEEKAIERGSAIPWK